MTIRSTMKAAATKAKPDRWRKVLGYGTAFCGFAIIVNGVLTGGDLPEYAVQGLGLITAGAAFFDE